MKIVVVALTFVVCTMAQRPSYAGTGPIGRPGLASRFRESNEETSTVNLNNRVGEGSTASTEPIPVDARGDSDLVNRLNQWPRENRPFWLLNAEHIEAQRNQNVNQIQNRNTFDDDATITISPPHQRSPFLPPIERR